ncbi:MAG: response regulator, partial [Candidatus Nitrosocosmicus sp.]
IESTIPKGTSKKVFEKVDHRLHVVHAPHRWYALEEKEHGVNQLRIIGGVSNCCLQHGLSFYVNSITTTTNTTASASTITSINSNINITQTKDTLSLNGTSSIVDSIPTTTTNANANPITFNNASSTYLNKLSLGIPMHPVSSIEVAELTKIIENAHRYLQISFAEELYLYCKANGISFTELRDSLNTKWNVDILEPRDGIGGHCLPKDTKMFINSSEISKSKILQAAMQVDESYREFIQNGEKYDFLNPNILVIDDDVYITNLVRESLVKNGFEVTVFNDPLLALKYFKINSKEINIVISDIDMPEINGMDLISEIKEIKPNIKAIFITAFDTDFIESALKKYDYNIDGIFQKPLRNKDLCNFVNLLLLPLVS